MRNRAVVRWSHFSIRWFDCRKLLTSFLRYSLRFWYWGKCSNFILADCPYLRKKIDVFQSALFNFQSLVSVILLLICTCTYLRAIAPKLIDRNKEGYEWLFYNVTLFAGWAPLLHTSASIAVFIHGLVLQWPTTYTIFSALHIRRISQEKGSQFGFS